MKAYRLTHSACILVRHSCVRPPRKSRVIKLWDIVSSALSSYWSPCADKSFLVLGLLDDRVSGSGNVQVITMGHLCLALAYTVHRDIASGTGLTVRDSCLRRRDVGGDSGCWALDPGELRDFRPRPVHPPALGQRDGGLFGEENRSRTMAEPHMRRDPLPASGHRCAGPSPRPVRTRHSAVYKTTFGLKEQVYGVHFSPKQHAI